MQLNTDEIPLTSRNSRGDKQRGKSPLFYIVVGAIFVFAVTALGMVFSGSSDMEASNFLASSYPSLKGTGFSSELSSNQISVRETPDIVFVEKTSVLAIVPPVTVTSKVLGAILGEGIIDLSTNTEILHYIVEDGDTIESVAEKFEVSSRTIFWANDLASSSSLAVGQEIIVLPVSGTLHLVRAHDTLSEISVWYKADADDIVEFNELTSPEGIFAGDLLVIPDGIMPKTLPQGRLTPLANSYFIYPVPRSHSLSQGLHAFNAVDLSNGKCSQPVYAAAGGTTQRVGYQSVAGNYIRVLHPNGVVTFYGHLGNQAVSVGERVLQGQIIGYTGHTGYTIPAGPSGCHLHFEVRGAKNPFTK